MLTNRGGSKNLTTPTFEFFSQHFGTFYQEELPLDVAEVLEPPLNVCFKNEQKSYFTFVISFIR